MIFNAAPAGGGDSLKIPIVTGMAQPDSPKADTLWVRTTATVTSFLLSPDQPETAAEGELLLVTADSGAAVTFGKKNRAALHLAFASLYTGGKWQPVEAKLYRDGTWLTVSTPALYKDGFFGAGKTTKVTNGSADIAGVPIVLKTSGGSKVSEVYAVLGPLALSGVDKVAMRAQMTSSTTDIYFAILAAKDPTAGRSTAELSVETKISDKEEHTLSLDVSSLSGNGWYLYFGINTAGGSWSAARTVSILEATLDG